METSALERVEVLFEIMVQRRQLLVLREEALLVGTCRNTRDVRVLENEMRG